MPNVRIGMNDLCVHIHVCVYLLRDGVWRENALQLIKFGNESVRLLYSHSSPHLMKNHFFLFLFSFFFFLWLN